MKVPKRKIFVVCIINLFTFVKSNSLMPEIDYNTIMIYFKPESGIATQERPAGTKAAIERMHGDNIAEILPKGVPRHRPKSIQDYKDRRIEELLKENQKLKLNQSNVEPKELPLPEIKTNLKANITPVMQSALKGQLTDQEKVINLSKSGKDVKAISKETGLHHTQVKKILKSVQ